MRVDLGEFCDFTGLSLRTARYALNRIRDDQGSHGLRFRTLWKHRPGRRGSWQVLASATDQLMFDGEPLFRSEDGRARHVRPSLREKPITPEKRSREMPPRGRPAGAEGKDTRRQFPAQNGGEEILFTTNEAKLPNHFHGDEPKRVTESECTPNEGGFFQNQQTPDKRPPDGGGFSRWRAGKKISRAGRVRLRRKAGAITRRLSELWWDNAKVSNPSEDRSARDGLSGFVFKSLLAGFTEAEISRATDQALHRLHGTATDRGEVFTVASTITRAKTILARDTRSRRERVATFYDERRREREAVLVEMRRSLALY